MQNRAAFLFFVILTTSTPALACSFAQLGSGSEYAGAQNFDFPPEVSAGIVVNKRNVEKTDGAFSGAPAAPQAKWVSKYGSVTFGFARENPVTGVNEAGLRVYRFLFLQGRYPAANAKPAINESQYVQYLLDTAESVEDVIQQTNAVQIYALDFPTHFAVCDRNAKCVFIEALNGKLEIFSGAEAKVNAMTNTDYSKSLSLFEKCPSGDCSDITDNSDWRFVKAASQVRDFSGTDLVTGLFSIMGSVKQMGTRIASLWTLLSHRSSTKDEFFVQNSKFSRNLITLDLRKLDFSCKTPVQVALLHPADSSPVHLTDYTLEFQTELSEVVQKYLGVSLADMQKRIEYPQLHTRCLD